MKPSYILTIDQGTTSSRSLLYSPLENKILSVEQVEFKQYFPQDGWVEHDLEEIWSTALATARKVIEKTDSLDQIAAIGITNQRETTAIWDASGKPVHRAIVWQDRRTSERCREMKDAGLEPLVREKTGLFLDPYFCASKIEWIINQIPEGRRRMEAGELHFATIDGFLLWRLTGEYAIDTTNASRTGIFNIHSRTWDEELLRLYSLHPSLLPQVKPSNSRFGITKKEWFGKEIPIFGMVGDQQSSLFGHLGFHPGEVKSTYGTGAFLLANLGEKPVPSKTGLLTTIGIDLDLGGRAMTHYAFEGSIFIAGAVLKWLKEKMHFMDSYEELNAIDLKHPSPDHLVLVPAFSGLGSPHWVPEARGLLIGLTRNSDPEMILKAALESIALQTHDLLSGIRSDGITLSGLKVDGGVSRNDRFCQLLADVLQLPILRPESVETTALGSALVAALGCGIFSSLEELEKTLRGSGSHSFTPEEFPYGEKLISQWGKAVACVKGYAGEPV